MKKHVFGLLALALALPALAPPQIAAAARTEIESRITGPTFFAFFESTDQTGCIFTSVTVFGSKQTEHNPPGPPQADNQAAVAVLQWDDCEGEPLAEASGYTRSFDFQMDGNLRTATLAATIPVTDIVDNTTYNVSVNLTWTGTGELRREGARPLRLWRAAQAVGTVTKGTTNFTPAPSEAGELTDLR